LVTLNNEIDEFPDKGTGEEGRFVMIKKVFKEHPIKIIFAFLCILLFIGLEIWDDHAPLSIHNWNKKEISRIKIADPDNFTFAVFGDNKGNYSFFEPLLSDVAQDKEIAFAMDLGDLVGDGRRGQYRRFLNQVQKNVVIPFLTAIGNHDLENGSNNNYQETFGPTYYAFQVGQCCFIVLDASKGSGFDRTERQWLEGELRKAQDMKARFVFMHIPPFDPRRDGIYLQGKDRNDLLDLFRRYKVTHLFTSHIHGYFSGTWEGIPYTITGGAGAELQGNDPEHFFHHYMKVHVSNTKVDLTVRRIHAEDAMVRFYYLIKYHPAEVGLLLCAGMCMFTLWLSVRRRTDTL
jgi:3',5'-cyclic AMP phosphodiesterase CpdA